MWMYSIAPAEELCVKGHSYTTFISAPRTAVDRDLSKWHSGSGEQVGSILARGTANCVLVILQGDV